MGARKLSYYKEIAPKKMALISKGNTGSFLENTPKNYSDYFPACPVHTGFGMLACPMNTGLPNRYETGNEYRYGFNGMEKDDEVSGEGNSYTAEFRQYDTRIARWKSLDPVSFESWSPYNAFDGNPIYWSDPSGGAVEDWYKPKDGGDAVWYEGSEKKDGFDWLGRNRVEEGENGNILIFKGNTSTPTSYEVSNNQIDLTVMFENNFEIPTYKDEATITSSGYSDLNVFSKQLEGIGITVNEMVLVFHGNFNLETNMYIRAESGSYNPIGGLKFLNNVLTGSSTLILYGCGVACPTKEGYKQNVKDLKELSKSLGGATVYAPYGSVTTRFFLEEGSANFGDYNELLIYYKGKVKDKTTIQLLIKYDDLWIEINNNKIYQFHNLKYEKGKDSEQNYKPKKNRKRVKKNPFKN